MQNREVVYLKKEPKYFFLRIFNEQEDYETQIMKECEAFYNQFSCYPNAIVMNPETFDRWFSCVENSVDETEEEDFGNLSLDELKQKLTDFLQKQIDITKEEMNDFSESCEFKPSEDNKATIFATDKYELFIIDNCGYQDGVYQLLNGYSPSFENGKFTYPLVDMEATGENIKNLMVKNQISPTQIQQICGLSSVQAVYKWMNGKSIPTVDNLGIISNLFNVSLDDIVIFTTRTE